MQFGETLATVKWTNHCVNHGIKNGI